jgi:hypothetical protein
MRGARRTESRVEESIVSLFEGIPSLCGFTVASRASGLELSDIGLYPPPPDSELQLIQEDIRVTLSELLDEQPEARGFLSGRTFARALH